VRRVRRPSWVAALLVSLNSGLKAKAHKFNLITFIGKLLSGTVIGMLVGGPAGASGGGIAGGAAYDTVTTVATNKPQGKPALQTYVTVGFRSGL
jgi:hypothetical protein